MILTLELEWIVMLFTERRNIREGIGVCENSRLSCSLGGEAQIQIWESNAYRIEEAIVCRLKKVKGQRIELWGIPRKKREHECMKYCV